MAGNSRYAPYLGKLDTTALAQILDASVEPANDVRLATPLGSVDPDTMYRLGSEPVLRWRSHQLDTLLTAVGIAGYTCTGDGLEFSWIQRSAGGAFESSGKKVTAAKAFVVPEQLSARVGEYAEISYAGHAYSSNGTTQQLAKGDAYSSGTPAESEKFTLGAVTINSVTYKVLGVALSFGIQVQRYRDPAHLYATSVAITSRAPTLELEVVDFGNLADTYLVGTEVSSIVVNLLKLATSGGGLAGSGDKSLTMTKAALQITGIRGTQGGDAVMTMSAGARKEGANPILTVA
jgi:hypothetical protein